MDVWKMKLFLVLNGISHSFSLLTREISLSTLDINFIFPNIHVLFSTDLYSLFNLFHYTVNKNFYFNQIR